MSYLTKVKFTILFIFLVLVLFVYQTTTATLRSYTASSYAKNIDILEGNYKASINLYQVMADGFYHSLINQENILSLVSQAKNAQDAQKKTELRQQLYHLLEPHYKSLQKKGLNIVLFAFEDNSVFLRVHKLSKYNDDISSVRKIIVDVNANKKIIRGFEQGKVSHAFRNVYPIYYKNEYLGCVDISFSSESMQNYISNINGVYTHFLVKKSLFDTRLWKSVRSVSYIQSSEHEEYLYTKTASDSAERSNDLYTQLSELLKTQIKENMDAQRSFALSVDKDEASYILAFKPIRGYKNTEVMAYIVSYVPNKDLYTVRQGYYLINASLFLILAFLALTLFYIIKQRESLKQDVMQKTKMIEKKRRKIEKILQSFDKNVIYSRTDMRGVITHVSEAFCEISGYTEEELLGKPHNVVRHEDMPKEVFEQMWNSLQKEGKWTGEVKNKRKDGSSYWVYSKIERDYDDFGNPLGYYAVREDITSKKEVETLKAELEEFNKHLEAEVQERTQEVIALSDEIQETQREVVFTMGAIGESRSKETGNHVKRVAEYSKLLALHYGLDPEDAELLKQASPMHDIGKVAIPDAILNKPGRFNNEEREIMDTHAQLGYEMLKHSSRPLLKMAATIAYEHHEKWDGTGYPNKLVGENISIYGRITALADVFDALGSDRVYKKAWDLERILELFKEERGKHFDPQLIDIFLENLEQFLEIRDRFQN
ncbi:MAG: HD domain-containing protein [Helicobacteraceae bacterium]|nr:HD domain-containing protein [Helicobacteraceae bacterium]